MMPGTCCLVTPRHESSAMPASVFNDSDLDDIASWVRFAKTPKTERVQVRTARCSMRAGSGSHRILVISVVARTRPQNATDAIPTTSRLRSKDN